MSLDSITSVATSATMKPLNTTVTLNQSAKDTPLSNGKSPQTSKTDAVASSDPNKISPDNKLAIDANIESKQKPVRSMSHMVVSYNQQGEVRTKFLDSNNNVVYQIPSEMVAKMEDLMMNQETSANVKG